MRVQDKLILRYLQQRINDQSYLFSKNDMLYIEWASNNGANIVNTNHTLLLGNPVEDYQNKGESDRFAVDLWNEIFPERFSVSHISQIKPNASDFIDYIDDMKPNGIGGTESEMVQYVTAHSSSSFIGIQQPSKSRTAMDSMINTLNSHTMYDVVEKPWLIDNLSFLESHINRYPDKMDRGYEDICMSARTSSSSITGSGSFRNYVLEHSFDEIVHDALRNEIPMLFYAGTRSDRRGKYRLICSCDARFRVLDYMLNNGSYALCEHQGILSNYTTEGYNNAMMWPQLVAMSNRRDGNIMICIDYSGYDTQISLKEYLNISKLLNQYRIKHGVWSDIWNWYEEWMLQPKPLVTRSIADVDVLIPYYRTLASGLHGTHSFENLIGISTMIEASNRGIPVVRFWSNGDDQNTLIKYQYLDRYTQFLESYYKISWPKSLINHKMSVWGRLWFARDFHPTWEIGTFRSLWEREGGEVSFVENSKFQNNYCKILQVAITLIRLGKHDNVVKFWINKLSHVIGVNPNKIPIKLNMLNVNTSTQSSNRVPVGLKSVKNELLNRTFRLRSLTSNNYYDMLLNMYQNNTFYDMNVDEIKYHEEGKTFYFNRGVDYSRMVPRDVPWVYKELYTGIDFSLQDRFNRDILQSTKSYDGPCSLTFSYNNMFTLAHAINDRNRYVWERML